MKYQDVTKEKIVAAIKALGYNLKQVSVKRDSAYYVTVRDPQVDADAVEDAVKCYEKVYRCEASGEILSGGNTFIFVRIDDRVLDAWAAPYQEAIKKTIANLPEERGVGIKIEEFPGYSIVRDHSNKYFLHLSFWSEDGGYTSLGHQFGLESYRGIGVAIHNHKVELAREESKKNVEAMVVAGGKGKGFSTTLKDEIQKTVEFLAETDVAIYDQVTESVKEVARIQNVSIDHIANVGAVIADFGTVQLVRYSDRAVALFGETKPIKDVLSNAKGKFNNYLKYNGETKPGWIFPYSRLEEVKQLMS